MEINIFCVRAEPPCNYTKNAVRSPLLMRDVKKRKRNGNDPITNVAIYKRPKQEKAIVQYLIS